MRIIVAALAVAFAAALAACSGPDPSAYQTVDQMYGAIQRNDVEAAAAMMEPSQQASLRGGIGQLNSMVPQGAPTSSSNAGWEVNVNAGQARQTIVTREYTYPDWVVTARATLIDGPGTPRWLVRGFNINSRATGSGASSAAAPDSSAPATAPTAPSAPSGDAGSAAPPADSGAATPSESSGPAETGHSGETASEGNSGSPVEGQ